MDEDFKLLLHPIDFDRLRRIRKKVFTKLSALNVRVNKSKEPIPFKDRASSYDKIHRGQAWGHMFDCAWFHFTGEIKEEYKNLDLCVILDVRGEGLIVSDTNEALQGISHIINIQTVSEYLNPPIGKTYYRLDKNLDNVDLWMDAGFNGIGGHDIFTGRLMHAYIASFNQDIYDYYFNYLSLAYLIYTLDGDAKAKAMSSLNESYKLYLKKDYKKAIEITKRELTGQADDSLTFTCVGHSHLDLAWLWPMRETHRKAARTLSTAVKNMRMYKEYIYGASQPQEFVWIKEEYPKLYNDLKELHKKGQFEVQGGMWVECDTNLSGGESLIRQFQYGMKFWEDEFGCTVNNCWLPDVFGYSAALPQIIKKCGIPYFMTQKLSWNNINEFKLQTFNWSGLSSDEVLVHLLPANRYDSSCTATIIKEAAIRHKSKDKVGNEALICYGAGDGGGGPCECDIEFIKHYSEAPGLPRLKFGRASDFFERLALNIDKYPSFKGELYLEKHQGTYTTQSDIKKNNRTCERLLHIYEAVGSFAIKEGYAYQAERVDKLWKNVLLFQFHDILPGSSIERVNRETNVRYKEIISELNSLINEAFAYLKKGDNGYSAYNPAPVRQKGYLRRKKHWYYYDLMPYTAGELIEVNPKDKTLGASKNMIENNILSVRFNPQGFIDSIIDKGSGHEYNKAGLGILNIYRDKKLFFNAWDIDINYTKHKPHHMKLIKSNLYVEGLEAIYEGVFKYGRSKVVEKVILRRDLPYLIFDLRIDWHEKHKMLRADFRPSSYSDIVDCDIQFGNIKRSTKNDNLLDYAKFEICAHKYVDVSDCKCGSAILSNSKYGFRCKDGLMSLNLLRSPVYPDKHADRGKHHISYAYYPHIGNKEKANVIDYAYMFNYNPIILDGNFKIDSICSVDNPNIIIETIKPAMDKNGIVCRLYESKGSNNNTTFSVNIDYKRIYESDMRENNRREINRSLCFTPYEIKTIIIE